MGAAMSMVPIESPWYAVDGWGGNVIDGHGVEWVVTSEEGWSAAAATRLSLGDNDSVDGQRDAPGYDDARLITLAGTAIAPNRHEQNRAKDRLNAACQGRGLHQLVVTEAHETRAAFVRRTGQAKVGDRGSLAFDFALTLVAPDPRKYGATDIVKTAVAVPLDAADDPIGVVESVVGGGPAVAAGGRPYPRSYQVAYAGAGDPGPGTADRRADAAAAGIGAVSGTALLVDNRGTRDTGGVIEIRGGLTNPLIANLRTGETIGFGLTLGADDVLAVDLLARTVVLNRTSSRRAAITTGSAWWLHEPGQTWLRLGGIPTGDGNPRMTVTYRPAWK